MSGVREPAAQDTRTTDSLSQPALFAAAIDIDSRGILRGILRAAQDVCDAAYAALAVIGEDRTFVDFIAEGIDESEAARIGSSPATQGVLNRLIDDPRSLRLRRLDEPSGAGIVPATNHRPPTSFLGVPVRVKDDVFGVLYLTGKRSGEEFTDADERAVTALGATAGVAIENARLYGLSQRRGRWLEASADITRMLLERADRDTALQAVTRRARELSGSAAACVLLADDRDSLVVHACDGDTPGDLRGHVVPIDDPALTRVLRDGLPTTVDDLRRLFGSAAPDGIPRRPALLVPFRSSRNTAGILLVVKPDPPPSPEDEYMLQTFADQAAIALDLAQARSDSEMVVVLEDRDRIARDLHDVVIQRLFATGLMLQGARRAAAPPEVRERVETAVNELDITIRDLRTAIFELHRHTPTSFRSEIGRLISDYANVLGFPPRLSTKGPLESLISGELRTHVLAVLREALSNVAKHAQATSVEISVTGNEQEVVARVSDNGVGLKISSGESGLRNLRERADALGGTLSIDQAEPNGTVVEWRVPLPRQQSQ